MYIAGYRILIGIWDIIALLLPITITVVSLDLRHKHKRRMKRLVMIDEGLAKLANSKSKSVNEEMIDILVDKNI